MTTGMTSSSAVNSKSDLSVKLSQSNFQNALSLVSKAVAKHGIQPVLSNVLLKTNQENNTLTLAATDLNLSLAATVLCEVIESGEITVPSQKLLELVSKLSQSELSFESDERGLIKITCGRSKFEIKGLSSEQFPQDFLTVVTEDVKSISLSTALLKEAIELVGFASDKREVNSILNGICLEISDKGLEIAATDGSRLAYFSLASCKADEHFKVIIPFRSLVELSRMLSSINDDFVQCIFPNNNQIIFKSENKTLSTSLIDGTYPKYQQLIPLSHSQKATVNRSNLLSCLERVSVLANERTKVVKLFFEAIGVLNVSASTPDLGEASDQLDMAGYEGNDFTIAFNVNYMIECLRNLDSEEVEITMSEPLKPIIVSPKNKKDNEEESSEEQNNYLYLLMPVQMRNAG